MSDDPHVQALERHCVQGERAMHHLVWTMANVTWRRNLETLANRVRCAEAALAEIEAKPYRAEEVTARYRRETT